MDPIPGTKFIMGNVLSDKIKLDIPEFFDMDRVNLVLSDFLPQYSGDLE